MKNTNVYVAARKIHRFLVVFILSIGLVMATTGLCMYSGNYLSFDPMTIRGLHYQLSVVFAVVLGMMGLTGFYLFIFPHLR